MSQQEITNSIPRSQEQILGLKAVQRPKIPAKEEQMFKWCTQVSNHIHVQQSFNFKVRDNNLTLIEKYLHFVGRLL